MLCFYRGRRPFPVCILAGRADFSVLASPRWHDRKVAMLAVPVVQWHKCKLQTNDSDHEAQMLAVEPLALGVA